MLWQLVERIWNMELATLHKQLRQNFVSLATKQVEDDYKKFMRILMGIGM